MLKSLFGGLLTASVLVLGIASVSKAADDALKPTPMIRTVTPDSAKAGDTLTLAGDNLDKTYVKDFYLTDGTNDFKADVVEQGKETVTVKISAKVKAGRFHLMLLTTGNPARFLEMPVVVTVE